MAGGAYRSRSAEGTRQHATPPRRGNLAAACWPIRIAARDGAAHGVDHVSRRPGRAARAVDREPRQWRASGAAHVAVRLRHPNAPIAAAAACPRRVSASKPSRAGRCRARRSRRQECRANPHAPWKRRPARPRAAPQSRESSGGGMGATRNAAATAAAAAATAAAAAASIPRRAAAKAARTGVKS